MSVLPKPSLRRTLTALSGVAAALALSVPAAGALTSGPTSATATATPAAHGQDAFRGRTDAAVRKSLKALVKEDGFPGALASLSDPGGRARNYTAGVGNLKTGSKVPTDGQVRIASNTKMFTATVVLQLVGEGRIDLDAPIETYLPGLVRGDGIDGHDITVRQLLQHTSGLADYDEEVVKDYLTKQQHRYFEPRELVEFGLGKKALFAPGSGWSYSNTNYVLAGLLVQKVTGRPVGEEITHRIIEPLGLRHTYWPGVGDQTIKGRHPHGYFATAPNTPYTDVTEQDPSAGWAAGGLVGTPSDLNRFLTALLDGKLLEPEQLKEMKTTVDAPDLDTVGDGHYGLGLATFKLSCGGYAWTHGGNAPGYTTRNAVTEDGRAATIAVTALPTTLPAAEHIEAALDTALCTR
ncbi:serine hydrolase domain-containing protein [Streptomyces coelicoflavus]|uniref:serine hydrolase domain-containing protein n=1 Tax=Streptomyces coelicoflavus TaxID=285562 RepID=UPI003676CC15